MKEVIGINPFGVWIRIPRTTLNIWTKYGAVGRTSTTLFDSFVELFPALSKTEIRRLIQGGAAKGCLAQPITLEDATTIEIRDEPSKVDFEMVILGKTKLFGYRSGIIVYDRHNSRARRLFLKVRAALRQKGK